MKDIEIKYTVEECSFIWKCRQTKGFTNKEQYNEYKNYVVPNYKAQTGRDLPNITYGKKDKNGAQDSEEI